MQGPQHAEIEQIVQLITDDYSKGRNIDKMDVLHQPDQDKVMDIVQKLLRLIFPGYYRDRVYKGFSEKARLGVLIEDVIYNLQKQIAIVLHYCPEFENADQDALEARAACVTTAFTRQIPKLREYVDTDLQATFDGDPAASGIDEIVLCYPGIYATTLNRIAHELFVLDVPLIPRMITEYAHQKTGIDIHPGATIGKYFMIDHGTGVVVGSTTIIGDHVKVYQGVTLGALSTRAGQKLRGKKRHPTIEDYVTIYSGASILGGETVIGHGSVIGSNAFITKSVAPDSRVSIQQDMHHHTGNADDNNFDSEKMDTDETWFYVI
ncbi:MAG: serine acetyltransferase [Lachnospiraceae bacterium]|nr:serine acetyltransferase [Lachnospiraceae bacterium]